MSSYRMPILLLTALLGIAPAGAAESDPTGWWLDESGRAGIVIAPCGDRLCGTVQWLKEPNDRVTGKPKTDRQNSDATLKQRPLCGLPILWDFKAASPGTWEEGRIYDPEGGDTYKSTMELRDDGTLKVRGYIGLPLLGRSQIWSRPATALTNCGGG